MVLYRYWSEEGLDFLTITAKCSLSSIVKAKPVEHLYLPVFQTQLWKQILIYCMKHITVLLCRIDHTCHLYIDLQAGHPVLEEIHRKLVSVVKQVEAFKNILEPRYMNKASNLCVGGFD